MRKILLSSSAIISGIWGGVLYAEESASQETARAPQPSPAEELVFLRDRMAVQGLRLDQAEQAISRQNKLIDLQEQKIQQLEKELGIQRARSAKRQAAPNFASESSGIYVVKKNDNLFRIALRHDLTTTALARMNGIKSPYTLQVGQRLKVPVEQSTLLANAQISIADQSQTPKSMAPAPSTPSKKAVEAQTQKTEPTRTAQANQPQPQAPQNQNGALPQEVGARPEEEDKNPYLAIFSDVGGILTPKGTMYISPSVNLTTSTDSRFFVSGINVIDTVFVGSDIEASDTDQQSVSAGLGFRYGITSRFEVDANIPYFSRSDRVSDIVLDEDGSNIRDLDGSGFGDLSFGAHYQLNQGGKWPYIIANLRAKAPTGTSPFDLERDEDGRDTELATGSGYWALEPSITITKPTAPAVIFANIGYLANLSREFDRPAGLAEDETALAHIDPGDAIKASVGVGLSLNDRLSVNFGYNSSYFFKTRSTIDRFDEGTGERRLVGATQPSLVVGSFLFGGSYAVNDDFRLNLNTSFGATDEAADMSVSIRAQYKLFD